MPWMTKTGSANREVTIGSKIPRHIVGQFPLRIILVKAERRARIEVPVAKGTKKKKKKKKN